MISRKKDNNLHKIFDKIKDWKSLKKEETFFLHQQATIIKITISPPNCQ
jgi:hypothetical protein